MGAVPNSSCLIAPQTIPKIGSPQTRLGAPPALGSSATAITSGTGPSKTRSFESPNRSGPRGDRSAPPAAASFPHSCFFCASPSTVPTGTPALIQNNPIDGDPLAHIRHFGLPDGFARTFAGIRSVFVDNPCPTLGCLSIPHQGTLAVPFVCLIARHIFTLGVEGKKAGPWCGSNTVREIIFELYLIRPSRSFYSDPRARKSAVLQTSAPLAPPSPISTPHPPGEPHSLGLMGYIAPCFPSLPLAGVHPSPRPLRDRIVPPPRPGLDKGAGDTHGAVSFIAFSFSKAVMYPLFLSTGCGASFSGSCR